MDSLNFNSVETLPGYEARAAFVVNASAVFREDVDIGIRPKKAGLIFKSA